MKKKFLLLAVLSMFTTLLFSQGVAIGGANPDPSAMLDIQGNGKGILVPRLTEAERNAIASPATGLLVFQTNGTPGFYYNNGISAAPSWTLLTTGGWKLGGNAGINPAAQFLGTTDANHLRVLTNNTIRMIVLANGQVVINGIGARSNMDGLEVYGTGIPGVVAAYDFPINGYTGNTGAAGIYGENSGTGQGVLGQNAGTGAGVYGNNSAVGAGGEGVVGVSSNNAGVRGQTSNNVQAGVVGSSSHANGFGVVGLGNNIPAFNSIGGGAGVLGQGELFGVVGLASTPSSANTTGKWGGYFDYMPGANSFAFIAGREGATDYGILSTGVKSTMVKDEQNRNRIMYCTEAPEVLFQDVGTGKLVNGRAHITIDPLLVRNIFVSESKPLKVFIQLEGDCKGVYVTNKSASGFDVIELQGGQSNTPFTFQIIANRANSTDEAGRVTSRFAESRFPIGPERRAQKGKEALRTTQLTPVQTPEKLLIKEQ